jgi:hypothetical protein
MNALLGALGDRLKGIPATFATWSTVAAFVLYLLGYLSLRFHLTTLGVGTDLTVLDERYLFSGAKFLVYLASAVPLVVMLGALLLGPPWWLLARIAPSAVERLQSMVRTGHAAATIAGIAASVLFTQTVMKQCFLVSNVLLGPPPSAEAPWPARLLANDALMPLFFSALVAGVAFPLAILLLKDGAGVSGPPRPALRGLLWVLVAIQLLLLPVNFGTLILDKTVPQVAALGAERVPEGGTAWLVWEGKEGMTYFVRRPGNVRSLLTLPRQDIKRMEITAYDKLGTIVAVPPELHAH